MELLLYARSSSARLQYICQFIFADLWSVKYSITSDESAFEQFNGIKLRYANEAALPGCVTIGDCGLLFESDIREQRLSFDLINGIKAFFITKETDVPFDLLSASFYLLSRYEEYLPHKLDQYRTIRARKFLSLQGELLRTAHHQYLGHSARRNDPTKAWYVH
jgi:hypothetical protein